jgi:tetratricopeptide (TPR) repeat protein
LVKKNDPAIQMQVSSGEMISVLPSPNFYMEQNSEEIARANFVPEKYKALVKDRIEWNFGERDILKNDLLVLDMIAQNNWKRPIYFSGTLSPSSYMNLKEYCQLEGYAYRLMPFKVEGSRDGFVNSDIMKDRLTNKMAWRNLNNPNVYYDSETYLKVPIVTARFAFLRLVDELVREGKKDEAEKFLDKSLELMPDNTVPYDQLVSNYPIFYYEIGKPEKAKKIAEVMVNRADQELNYFIEQNKTPGNRQWGDGNIQQFIQSNMRTLQMLSSAAEQYDKPLSVKFKKIYDGHLAKIQ